MDKILLFIIFIVIYVIIIKIVRKCLFDYIVEINQIGELNDSESYYNNYFKTSIKKNNRQMINNVAFIREGLLTSIYKSDIKILELGKLIDNDSILIYNNNDCNFDIYLAQQIFESSKNINIVIAKTELLEVEKCQHLINNLGYQNNIETIYLNDINKIADRRFNRIILRENVGMIHDRKNLFSHFYNLLADEHSFIYLKTLVFKEIDSNDKFLIKKQLDIIDFWNYNFSTSEDIINDLKINNFSVNFKNINVLILSIFYNPQDIINILKLYFVDLELGVCDIINWLAIYTLRLLHIKAYKTS